MQPFRLDMTQGLRQELRLTPSMIHSMEVLQLPQNLLTERIEKELQENPFLEVREHLGHEKADKPTDPTGEVETFNPNKPLESDPDNALDFQRLERLDRELGGVFNEENLPSRAARQEMSDRKMEAMANIADRAPSLQDHLAEQLNYITLTALERSRVEYLIYNLDERGYLSMPLEALAETSGIEGQLDDWELALEKLQELEPSGVGARDLKECLFLQIGDDEEYSEILRTLIRSHLEDISQGKLSYIQKATGYDLADIKEAIQALRGLNPRPATGFETIGTQYVTADIIIRQNEETGEYTIELTDDRQPQIFLNRKYLDLFKGKTVTDSEKSVMQKNYQSAQLLLNSIEQRKSTLKRVAEAIVSHQKAFLDKGPDYIVPLKMQDIADDIRVHVTTISRAVAEKYVQTPRGLFALKRFFGGGMRNTETGEDVAYEKIKSKLMEFVKEEDRNNPLSDEEIVLKVKSIGLNVARRTVTKYRKLMKIPSSRQRKDWHQ